MNRQRYSRIARAAALTLAVVLAVLVISQGADARVRRKHCRIRGNYHTQEGLAFSVGVGRTSFDAELSGLDRPRAASALTLSLSYGLSERVTLFGSLAGSTYDPDYYNEWSVGYADLGLRFSFVSNPRQRTWPYISATIGGTELEADVDREYFGGSVRLAGGIDYFITPHTLFFFEAGLRAGEFNRLHSGGDDYRLLDEHGFSSVGILFGLRFKL